MRGATPVGGRSACRGRPRARGAFVRRELDALGRYRRREQRRLLPGGTGSGRRVRGRIGAGGAALGGRRGAPGGDRGHGVSSCLRPFTLPTSGGRPARPPRSTDVGGSVGGRTGDDGRSSRRIRFEGAKARTLATTGTRTREPTSGLEPLTCSLRVGHSLVRVVSTCPQNRIDKQISWFQNQFMVRRIPSSVNPVGISVGINS